MHYDASKAPDPEAWLELDEQDRIDQVIDYHKRAKKPVGENNKLHAAAHVIVENQAAMGDATVVPATLDRHDTRHRQCSRGHLLRCGQEPRQAGGHQRPIRSRTRRVDRSKLASGVEACDA